MTSVAKKAKEPPNVVYIVQCINWEYDDQNYYSRDNSGYPHYAFTSSDAAERARTDLELSAINGENLLSFVYDYDDIAADGLWDENLRSELSDIMAGTESEITEDTLELSGVTPELHTLLSKYISIPTFYDVTEVLLSNNYIAQN